MPRICLVQYSETTVRSCVTRDGRLRHWQMAMIKMSLMPQTSSLGIVPASLPNDRRVSSVLSAAAI